MAIWGWGYGGYLTIRTLSQDSRISTILKRSGGRFSVKNQTISVEDSLLKCGLSIAPITQWQHHNPLVTQRSVFLKVMVELEKYFVYSRFMGAPDLEDNWDNYNSADLTKWDNTTSVKCIHCSILSETVLSFCKRHLPNPLLDNNFCFNAFPSQSDLHYIFV